MDTWGEKKKSPSQCKDITPVKGSRAPNEKKKPHTHPVFIFNDVVADRDQRGPLAVVGGANGTALVGLKFAHFGKTASQKWCSHLLENVHVCVCVWERTFAGKAVGGDARQGLPADIAEGGPGVGASVPVVHSRKMLHVELAGLRGEGSRHKRSAACLP